MHAFPKSGPKPLLVLMGITPTARSRLQAGARIDKLFKDFPVVLYVSAHTPIPLSTSSTATPKSNWLELNLVLISDWTPEFRFLSLNQSAGQDQASS